MNRSTHRELLRRKRRIERRLARAARRHRARPVPVLAARNIRYEVAGRAKGVSCGGVGAMHLLARHVGLPQAIDGRLHLLKRHLPYHESDHVLSIAYNILAGGTCIEDLERLRADEAVLDGLGAESIPDPTTAGDFCRRFTAEDVEALMGCVNEVRLRVWGQQPASSFERAVIDADGTLAPTTGRCKGGMDIAYDGTWGYHPLVVSLANTREPLFLVNRPGNRPSHEGAAERFDRAFDLCRRAGFKSILARGDTDFSQTAHLDRWDAAGDVTFLFGLDAMPNLVLLAEALDRSAWSRLDRPPKYQAKGEPRKRPRDVKRRVVRQRLFENVSTEREDVAAFDYRPTACKKAYRVVVLRKRLAVSMGQHRLWDEYRYLFYITNDRLTPAGGLVLLANGRCDQENLIEQLKNGVRAMKMPAHDLVSNWAYMVMASLAWTLKAWAGLLLPVSPGPHRPRHEGHKRDVLRMEFKRFANALVRLPCQVVKAGRRVVYRLLSWNPWAGTLLRAAEAWRRPLPFRPLTC